MIRRCAPSRQGDTVSADPVFADATATDFVRERQPAGHAAQQVWDRLERHGFAGWDPYDALNARRTPARVRREPLLSRVCLQTVKRFPIPLQPALGVPKAVSAYTLGHALLAVARFGERGLWRQVEAQGIAGVLFDELWAMRCPDCPGAGWGYHFPFRSRFTAYGERTPNIIVTAFVAKGLAAATRAGLLGCEAALSDVCTFVLEGLARETTADGQRFGYLPDYVDSIHNSNALAALVLAECGSIVGDAQVVEEAVAAADEIVAHQRGDGSWPYSEERQGAWVDSFHTGFVLEGLAAVHQARPRGETARAIARGFDFYLRSFFGPAGEPYYTPVKRYPYDALSAAEGLEVLALLTSWVPEGKDVRDRLLTWVLGHMIDGDGRVAFQVHRSWTDWREFPRWAAAPVCSALLAGPGGLQP